MRLNRFVIRSTSALTAAVFFWTSSVWAVPMAIPWQGIPNFSQLPAPAIFIPDHLGTVKSFQGASSPKRPTIIFIEDSHANYSAQSKIKDLLQYLQETESINQAFVEGAATTLDASKFKFFDDAERNQKVTEALAEQGEITGVELFLLSQNK